MLVLRNKKPKKDKSKARKRAMTAGRVALGVVIAGLVGFFVYTNIDYFSFVGDEAVDRLRAEDRVESRAKKSKRAANDGAAREHRSADEILGAPVFFERQEPRLLRTPDTPQVSSVQEPLTPPELQPKPDTVIPMPDTLPVPPAAALLPDTSTAAALQPPQLSLPPQLPAPQPPTPQIPPPRQPPPPPPKASETILLTNIMCRLSDRDDLRFRMSLELSFDNTALREEIYFKLDMLTTIASGVVRRFEFGSVTLAALGTELLISLNAQLNTGQLRGVDVKEFRAERL
ncbi:MAG: hypothetical protein LBC70_05130 [Chitinispirillales bacterium]|nr:hypothetical protein [Chitinispirillales bacterium]